MQPSRDVRYCLENALCLAGAQDVCARLLCRMSIPNQCICLVMSGLAAVLSPELPLVCISAAVCQTSFAGLVLVDCRGAQSQHGYLSHVRHAASSQNPAETEAVIRVSIHQSTALWGRTEKDGVPEIPINHCSRNYVALKVNCSKSLWVYA